MPSPAELDDLGRPTRPAIEWARAGRAPAMTPDPEVARLLHSLAGTLGSPMGPFTPPATHAEMAALTARGLAASCSPAGQRAARARSGGQNLESVSLLYAMAQQEMLRVLVAAQLGEVPDTTRLGAAMSALLSAMKGGGANKLAGSPRLAGAAGAAHGAEDPKQAEERAKAQTAIDAAIEKNDVGAMHRLAGDKKAMAAATPEQKAAMVNALSSDAQKTPQGNVHDRNAINAILGSARSDEELQTIMASADPEQVQKAMHQGVKDPENDSAVMQFNVTVSARGASEYATVKSHAEGAVEAREKGYSAEQILEARQKAVRSFGDDDAIKGVADDPLAMSLCTKREKSGMVKRLMDGYTTDSEDRAIVSILQSCKDKDEYDAVVNGAGGREVLDEIDDDEAKRKFNRLAGAYGRMDLVDNPAEAEKAKDTLVDPDKSERLLGGAGASAVQPRRTRRTGDPAGDFIAQHDEQIRARVSTLDRRAQVETILENADREKNGKPLLDPRALRNDVNEVMRNDKLTGAEKEAKIEELRKKEGLNDYTMRNITTQPIARIYEHGTQDAAGHAVQQAAQLEDRYRQAAATYGADSVEAEMARAELEAFKAKMGKHVKGLEGAAKKLNDMYPPPVSFLESIGGFLMGIVKAVAPALLNLIPGVGTALYAGYTAITSIVNIAKGDILGGLAGIANVLPGVGDMLGGAAKTVTDTLKTGLSAVSSVGRAIVSGNPLEILGAAGGAVGGTLGVSELSQGASIATAVGRGDLGGALSGAGGLLGGGLGLGLGDVPAVQQIGSLVGQGTSVANALIGGDYASAFGTAGSWIGLDCAGEIGRVVQDGASVFSAIQSGDLSGGLGRAASALGGLADPAMSELARVASGGVDFFNGIANGSFAGDLRALGSSVAAFGSGPEAQALGAQIAGLGGFASDVRQALAAGGSDPLAAATGLFGSAQAVARGLGSPDFANALAGLGGVAADLAESDLLSRVRAQVGNGAALMGAFQSGSFAAALGGLGVPGDFDMVLRSERLFGALGAGSVSLLAPAGETRQVIGQLEGWVGALGSGSAVNAMDRYSASLLALARQTGDPRWMAALLAEGRALSNVRRAPEPQVRALATALAPGWLARLEQHRALELVQQAEITQRWAMARRA